MLELHVSEKEAYDEAKQEFVLTAPTVLRLEHSLVSISKWEAKWKKPFLTSETKSEEETLDYVRCMTINQHVDPHVYTLLSAQEIDAISDYIDDNKTATTFREHARRNHQIVTSELIYYWIAQYNLPIEAQKWHLSRLLTLIRIASIKNEPEKKMSKRAILAQYRSLNAARRKATGSKG